MAKDGFKYFVNSYYFNKEDLKKEYYRLSKLYHPDKGGTNADMVQINKEYAILQNQTFRKSDRYKKIVKWNLNEVVQALKDREIDYRIDFDIVIAEGKNVYGSKDELKNTYGFWWDAKKKYWYWIKSHSKQKTA